MQPELYKVCKDNNHKGDSRASEIGCTDFEYSLERFKALKMENGKLTSETAREASIILQEEMESYYRNARREDCGLNVQATDFRLEGLDDFQKITDA